MNDEYFKKMFSEWIRTATHDGQADFQGGVALFKKIAGDQVDECISAIEALRHEFRLKNEWFIDRAISELRSIVSKEDGSADGK